MQIKIRQTAKQIIQHKPACHIIADEIQSLFSGSLKQPDNLTTMLKKWLNRIMPDKRQVRRQPNVRHRIALPLRHAGAEKVLNQLHQAGYEAYLVGGAVRDLLLDMQPKDFDIATNARPEQVRQLFRRSRIIGRRFQIVHVMVGSETIEVSTFRSGGKVRQNEHGRIMQDNAYGTLEQDVMRRDFTCNALYYDNRRQEIIDHHHGIEDIRARRLVIIGNPAERYQEDPVRILRAVRLSGKLGFTVDPATAEPIAAHTHLLRKEPVARLFDELLKILLSGHAAGCLKQLAALGIGGSIHPLFTAMLDAADPAQQHIGAQALAQTDQRLRQNQSVSVGFVLAALFWPQISRRSQIQAAQGQSAAAAITSAIAGLREDMEKGWGIPQRYTATMREIWQLQPQFANRRGRRPYRLLAQPRFRAAYDFLVLRARHEPELQETADWWTQFQQANEAARQRPRRRHAGQKTPPQTA